MSGEIENESTLKETLIPESVYKHQIIIKSIQFLGLFYIVYGIFVAFTNVCMNLDKETFKNRQLFRFWDPIAAIYSIFNILVFSVTIYYKYWNYQRGLSRLMALPTDHMIVCFILVPLFFFTLVNLIFEMIKEIVIIPCHGNLTCLIPFSTLLLFIGAIVLIFDVHQEIAITNNWKINLLKPNVVFFTVIGITNTFVMSFSFQHMLIFRNESQNSPYKDKFIPDESCINNNTIRKSITDNYAICDKYLRSTVLLFCVCSFAYLLQPMLKEDKTLKRNNNSNESLNSNMDDSNDSLTMDTNENTPIISNIPKVKVFHEQQTPSFRLPSAALVLCIIFLSLSFLSFIIMLSLHSSNDNLKIIGGLIFTIFPIFVYALGSGLSIVHIKEVGRWPIFYDRHGKVIEKCLIWIGAAGQLAISMATVACSIELLINPSGNETAVYTTRNVLLIPNHLLIVLQTFLQTILISLAIDRKWIRPEINSWPEVLCPAVGMMGLNIGLLLLSISAMNFPIIDEKMSSLFIELLLNGLKSIGGTLTTLQRLHASILFASMIVYTHN